MTSRENWIAALQHKPHEWKPSFSEVLRFGPEELGEYKGRGFVSQQAPFDPANFGGKGLFGVNWEYEAAVGGSIDMGRQYDDISEWRDKIVIDDIDAYDWEGIAKKNADYLNDPTRLKIMTIFTGYFERLIAFSSFEDAAMALIDPDAEDDVHALFDKLTDFYCEYIRRCVKYFGIDMFEFHDDWGSQRAPLFSPDTIEEMIFPHMQRVIDTCHELGCFFQLHSCGQIEPIIPLVIKHGVDTWVGQEVCDKEMLVTKYGDEFFFGVTVKPDPKKSLEENVAMIEHKAEFYKDKNVWWFDSLRSMRGEDLEKCKEALAKATGK